MRISVIIPCWNQAEYLSEAIESVLAQTYKDIEVIVVDDGSPDNAAEVAQRYPVKLIQQVNKGLAAARNTGIMNSTGEYILPLDSDDTLLPTCIERLVEKAKETNADVIGPSIRAFGYKTGDTILLKDPTFEDFKRGNCLAYCSMIKRDALLECGGYNTRMDQLGGYEDLSMWYDLMRRGKKIVTVQEPLVMYRTKEHSMWTNALKNHDNLWEQLVKDFPEVEAHRTYA